MPLKFCFDRQFRFVVRALTSRTATRYLLSSPLGNHCVFTQDQTPHSEVVGTWLTVALSPPIEAIQWWPHPLGFSSPSVPIPQFIAAPRSDSSFLLLAHYKPLHVQQWEMKALFTGFAELEPHLFSLTNILFLRYSSISTCSAILYTQTIWSSFPLYILQ